MPTVKSAVAGKKGCAVRETENDRPGLVSRVVRRPRASEGDSRSKEEGGQSAGPLYQKPSPERG